jgi:hypothetical protein
MQNRQRSSCQEILVYGDKILTKLKFLNYDVIEHPTCLFINPATSNVLFFEKRNYEQIFKRETANVEVVDELNLPKNHKEFILASCIIIQHVRNFNIPEEVVIKCVP